ncbi:helix-turn-helix domain-containing protein [Chitinophaga barathri]|uniref:AraC family transcriptional regulator n=1 Tax=Chitinophaga barathri TaxID=1647451 RepID=A0A3N4MCZ9_9BACT|nr:AraC family transcriptional regulator [Chitinophaga barathri]RPD37930.1 AraC family transcriptional regulator [Chitinophaga barathri]
MAKKNTIPVHAMSSPLGVQVKRMGGIDLKKDSFLLDAHRDDHWIFIFQVSGNSRMMVDFREVEANGSGAYFILPGQVHYGIGALDAELWFAAVDASLVGDVYRAVFEGHGTISSPLSVPPDASAMLQQCFGMLKESLEQDNDTSFRYQVSRSLLDALLGIFAGAFAAKGAGNNGSSQRAAIITRQFRSLLAHSYRELKRPSAYASALNISASYLNEAVKEVTGFPVSYWIQEEIMMEAKRLLFYTDNTVKQIADDLGFEDHTYFNRVFTKSAGISPLAFRKDCRK